MTDKITENNPSVFLYRCEKDSNHYEIIISLLPQLDSVIHFIAENDKLEDWICREFIEIHPDLAIGHWTFIGTEQVTINDINSINLYPYQVSIRLFYFPGESNFDEDEIMNFGQFLDYQEQN